MRRPPRETLSVPDKANRILNGILIAMMLIAVRLWQLTVIQHEDRVAEARKPQHREVWERAERATIHDRFNIPLAVNRVQYDIAICYNEVARIPAVSWTKDASGQRIKVLQRRQYIEQLADLLARELDLEPDRIADIITYKAVLFRKSFTIKEDVPEEKYYKLKILEKDWPGLLATRASKRYYPQGPVAGDVIGHMGMISRGQYDSIAIEMKTLRTFLEEFDRGDDPELPEGMASAGEVRHRMKELEERAYRMNDLVGKSGIEAVCDEQLRGYRGKRRYYADARGNFLRELPGSSDPLPGQRVLLSISSELQAFTETLLIENETLREGRSRTFDWDKKHYVPLRQPWIKGGAVIVIDPNTGDLLAFASHPRLNPNDFISVGDPARQQAQQRKVRQWLEVEQHVADIWEGRVPLSRERFDMKKGTFYEEQVPLTWDRYLGSILNTDSPLATAMRKIKTVGEAIALQQDFQGLLFLSRQQKAQVLANTLYATGIHKSYGDDVLPAEKEQIAKAFAASPITVAECRRTVDNALGAIPHNRDKLLAVDLCRVAVNGDAFSLELLEHVDRHPLSEYHQASGAMVSLKEVVKEQARSLFHDEDFRFWRDEQESTFIKGMRAEEKAKKRYARPALDYLDREEERQFIALWEEGQWIWLQAFLTGRLSYHPNPRIARYGVYFQAMYEQALQGAYASEVWIKGYDHSQRLLQGLPTPLALEYLMTMRGYHELTRPLLCTFPGVPKEKGVSLEKHLARTFYPQYGYGYSRSYAYRQATPLGSVFKLVTAYAAMLQRCRESPQMPSNLNPFVINEDYHRDPKTPTGWSVGYTAEGKSIPQFYKGGRIPRSHRKKMDSVDLLKALEASADVYFSLAAGDYLEKPEDLALAASDFGFGAKTGISLPGEIAGLLPTDLATNRSGLYEMAIGQHSLTVTPLQAAVMLSTIANGGSVLTPHIIHLMAGREPIRDIDTFVPDDEMFITTFDPDVQRQLFLPPSMKRMLLEGMRRVVNGQDGTARPAIVRTYDHKPEVIHEYRDMASQIVGKSSTAEKVERYALDGDRNVAIYNHVWFGGISYAPDQLALPLEKRRPELVVVVYLPYGDYGREAAPIMSQIVRKWREIKNIHK